jgi:hypothetical protein
MQSEERLEQIQEYEEMLLAIYDFMRKVLEAKQEVEKVEAKYQKERAEKTKIMDKIKGMFNKEERIDDKDALVSNAQIEYTVKENECFSNQYDVSSQKAPYNSQASNSEISYKPSERISNPIIKDPTPTVSSYQASNTSVHNEVTTNKVIDKSPKYCGRCGSVLTSGMCEKCDTVGASSFDEKNTYLIEEEKPVIEESQGELEEKRLEKQERIDAENQRKDSIYLAALTKCNSDDIAVLEQAIANFEFLSDWKDSKDRVKKCRDKMNYLIEKKESGLQERMRTMRRENNLCQYCGGNFKGLFTKVCTQCGSYKDY